MKKLIIPIGTIFLTGIFHAQISTAENYVHSRVYLEPVTSSSSTAKQFESVEYFDGLGRSKQIIDVKVTASGKDLVTTIPYDGFGRPVDSWLPVPMTSLNGGIQSGVDTSGITFYGDNNPFGHKLLDRSPLNRIVSQIQPGAEWQGHAVQFGYDSNLDSEVYKFTTATSFSNGATHSALKTALNSANTSSGFYKANKLYKNIVTDEDGNQTIEFKNGEGQLLMVRRIISATENADTYYVYNEYNLLAFVIPPKAMGLLKGSAIGEGYTIGEPILKDLCFQYRYDTRKRLVEKKLPGKEWEYMVYDKQDRLVMTQDANMGAEGNWMFTKYDQYGRKAYTGVYTSSQSYGSAGRLAEQGNVDSKGSNNVTRGSGIGFTSNGMDVYYDNLTSSSYPGTITKLLSVHYYDTYPSYSFNPAFPPNILNEPTLTDASSAELRSTKSLPVMTLIKNIEDDQWTKNYIYYDKKGRAISSYSINHLGGRTKIDSKLNFAGSADQTITQHKRLDIDIDRQIKENFTYDLKNRLLTHSHQVDHGFVETLSQNTYNDLGQLSNKKVGGYPSLSGGGFIQSIDYRYNIRGWMTKINDPENLNGKLFGYEIKYTNPVYSNVSLGKFNGNIAEIDWMTSRDNSLKRYNYSYDPLNRLTQGAYSEPNNSVPQNGYYNESASYDLNGNITNLQRNRNAANIGAELIDNLTYVYTGNRLDTVTDSSQNHFGYPDTSGTLIHYDNNGNMTDHNDKRISAITYNPLNLPSNIRMKTTISDPFGNYLEERAGFLYRADGVKVNKTYNSFSGRNNNRTSTIVDYLDGFQYNGTVSGIILDPWTPQPMQLQFVPTSEGYFDFVQNKYFYQYKDQLGNIRLSFYKDSNNAAVIDRTADYYPFGLTFGDNGVNIFGSLSPNYTYAYNGKEFQAENKMYDFGSRMYMPELGRWGITDPKSELLESASPYVYALNSPILYIDKDGELPILINGKVDKDSERASPTYWSAGVINAIKGSGIPNPGGQFHFVDGDRGVNFRNEMTKQASVYPQDRTEGGRRQAKADWSTILSKLQKDPKTGKITEKIQIYTHSRGGAFGEGYTEQLINLIKANANQFADANNVIEFVFDMAPHQSDYLSSVKGVSTYTMDHAGTWFGDPLSDNAKAGVKAAFTSKEGGNLGGGHRIPTFANDITAFTRSFTKAKNKQDVIDNFIKMMKDTYGITVTFRD